MLSYRVFLLLFGCLVHLTNCKQSSNRGADQAGEQRPEGRSVAKFSLLGESTLTKESVDFYLSWPINTRWFKRVDSMDLIVVSIDQKDASASEYFSKRKIDAGCYPFINDHEHYLLYFTKDPTKVVNELFLNQIGASLDSGLYNIGEICLDSSSLIYQISTTQCLENNLQPASCTLQKHRLFQRVEQNAGLAGKIGSFEDFFSLFSKRPKNSLIFPNPTSSRSLLIAERAFNDFKMSQIPMLENNKSIMNAIVRGDTAVVKPINQGAFGQIFPLWDNLVVKRFYDNNAALIIAQYKAIKVEFAEFEKRLLIPKNAETGQYQQFKDGPTLTRAMVVFERARGDGRRIYEEDLNLGDRRVLQADLLEGAAIIQKRGWVHMDLKPDQLLRFDDRFKLGDLDDAFKTTMLTPEHLFLAFKKSTSTPVYASKEKLLVQQQPNLLYQDLPSEFKEFFSKNHLSKHDDYAIGLALLYSENSRFLKALNEDAFLLQFKKWLTDNHPQALKNAQSQFYANNKGSLKAVGFSRQSFLQKVQAEHLNDFDHVIFTENLMFGQRDYMQMFLREKNSHFDPKFYEATKNLLDPKLSTRGTAEEAFTSLKKPV